MPAVNSELAPRLCIAKVFSNCARTGSTKTGLADLHRAQLRNGRSRRVEVSLVFFDPNAGIAKRFRCCESRTRTCEGIKHGTLAKWQHPPNDSPHERLRLKAWMRCKSAFLLARWRGRDHVAKWLVLRRPAKPPGLPVSQIILHAAFDWFTEDQPWLPHRPRHYAYIRELSVRCFWPVSAAHRHG